MRLHRVVRAAPASIALALALVLGTGHELRAQVAVGIRVGKAEGTANYDVGEVNARVRAWGPVYGSAAFELIGGAWACTGGTIDAVRCDYDGYSLSVGPALGASEGPLFVAVRAALGAFVRNSAGAGEFKGDRHLTGSIGMDGELSIAGSFRLQIGVTHRRIFDRTYDRVVGGVPNYTTLAAGISFVFGQRTRAR